MFACACVCVYRHIYIFLQIEQMSAVTKKKYVVNEALQNYRLPDEKNYIVKVRMRRII